MMSTLLTSALFISVYSIPNPPRSDNARRTGNGAGKCTLSRGTRDRSFRWMESESGNKERDRLRKRKERTRRSVSVPMGTRTRPPPHVPVRHLRNLSGLGPFRAVFAPAAVPAQRHPRSGETGATPPRGGAELSGKSPRPKDCCQEDSENVLRDVSPRLPVAENRRDVAGRVGFSGGERGEFRRDWGGHPRPVRPRTARFFRVCLNGRKCLLSVLLLPTRKFLKKALALSLKI